MQISQRNYRNYSYHTPRRGPVKRGGRARHSYTPLMAVVSVVVGAIVLTTLWPGSNDGQNNSVSQVQAEDVASPQAASPPKKQVDLSGLESSLSAVTKKYPYNTSVSVYELNSGKLVQSGDSYPFLAASTTKLLTAFVYLDEVQAGRASLTSKVGGTSAQVQIEQMINKSDNPAWKQLNGILGKERIEAYAKKHGLASYDAERNVVTSDDMARLLAKFYKRELLNEKNTSMVLSMMQNTSEERFIPPAVPKNNKLYHKAGYLDDRVHDVAIIDNGTTPYILVIYSKDYGPTYNYQTGQKLYKEVTNLVVSTFNR
jgi:beta-lactamase class A